MISETLASGLSQYKIGQKIRTLRLNKKLGLVQLGAHTGLSPALLSKIERGQLIPTLPTLLRIALVFGVGLEHFFVDSAEKPAVAVIRKSERLRLPERPGEDPSYLFESLDFSVTDRKMEAFFAEFPVQSKPSKPHQHPGAEFIYVIKGQLGVHMDAGDVIVLDEGDAIYFESGAAHSYERKGRSACTAIVVVAPP